MLWLVQRVMLDEQGEQTQNRKGNAPASDVCGGVSHVNLLVVVVKFVNGIDGL
jgi:hypothetical protein